MKNRLFLLLSLFIFTTTILMANVFVKDLGTIGKIEVEGKGKAGKTADPATNQMEALDTAKKSYQKEIADYVKGIKDAKGVTLEEIAQTSVPLQLIFAETIKEGKVVSREWDKEGNVLIKAQVDLIKLKQKLNKLGVE